MTPIDIAFGIILAVFMLGAALVAALVVGAMWESFLKWLDGDSIVAAVVKAICMLAAMAGIIYGLLWISR